MKRLALTIFATLAVLTTNAIAGPEETAIENFRKGCLAAPMNPERNYAYFNKVPGFRAWGPMRSYQVNRYQQGGSLKMGIFTLVNEGKREVFLVGKSFKPHQSMCIVEFTPTKSFQEFSNQGWAFLKRQKGFQGQIPAKSKKGIAASMGAFRIEMQPVAGGKKFQILIRKF